MSEQFDIGVQQLPDQGQHEGAVYQLTLEGNSIVDAVYQPEKTDDRREVVQERFDRLSTRLGDDSDHNS